jgi:hypothetical protein
MRNGDGGCRSAETAGQQTELARISCKVSALRAGGAPANPAVGSR